MDRGVSVGIAARVFGSLAKYMPFNQSARQFVSADFVATASQRYETGDGNGESNLVWFREELALRKNQTITLDLYDMSGVDLGMGVGKDNLGLPFFCSDVVGIVIGARGSEGVTVGGDGTATAWTSLLSNGTNTLAIGPDGFMAFVCNGNRKLQVNSHAQRKLKITGVGDDLVYVDLYFICQEEEESSSSSSMTSTSSSGESSSSSSSPSSSSESSSQNSSSSSSSSVNSSSSSSSSVNSSSSSASSTSSGSSSASSSSSNSSSSQSSSSSSP